MKNNESDNIRHPLPKRAARYMAKKWLGKRARPEEEDEYTKFFEDYVIKWLGLGGGALSIYHAVVGRRPETPTRSCNVAITSIARTFSKAAGTSPSSIGP